MAEEDAEIALLHQMQAGQESLAWEDGGENGAADGELPSNTENNNEKVMKEDSVADDQVLRALSPPVAGALSDGGDYDPSSITSHPTVTIAGQEVDSRSSSRASSRKPKTVGGFIADDSDDEEYDGSTPVQITGLTASNTLNRAISPSPLQNSISQHDLPNQADSKIDAHPTVPVNPNVAAGSAPGQSSSQVRTTTAAISSAPPKARLPNDRTGILEDRIKEDPRGDLEAWFSLITEHRNRNKLDDARAVYERFFKILPQAAEKWVEYTDMELENDNFEGAETIFGKSLLSVPNVSLWSRYLDYIRRRNDLTNDVTGSARATISQAYDFVLANIGIDKDSGRIWQEFIQFIRSAPGNIGGNSWQDQQKMDQLRKAYQRAVCVPMSSLQTLWTEYNDFEMNLNKATGRKFLQEKSPAYMTARGADSALKPLIRGLIRTTLPKLPPALGFDGDQEYLTQVELWKKWISWEQEDPLVLKDEDFEAYEQRVLYIYKQALMAMRFWPEMWVDAAEWCFNNGLDKEGDSFLADGIAANPESCLLAFKRGDRLETTLSTEEADKSAAEQGQIVRAPYDKLLDALYDSIKELKVRETRDLIKLEESAALDASISAIISKAEDDDEDGDAKDKEVREAAKANQAKAISQGYAIQSQTLGRTLSFAWIALMRAMRRVQGKGAVNAAVGGSRQIFADARARGKLTSDVYVASALIEHHVYKDPAGTKIFERGAKLFPEDEVFILEYLKHLISIGDTTNARAAFETSVNRLTQKPELVSKAKPLYVYFHKYESKYGELSQIRKLEQRMGELFPDDPKLLRFASRYSGEGFDPTAVRPIVSPATQMRPKNVMQSIEQPTPVTNSPRPQYAQENSPRPQYLQATNSPKRPFPTEDFENDLNRPRKLARGESPLKGAAGRRLDQQKRLQQTQGTPTWQPNAPPFVVPRDITFLLSIIPRADLSGTLPKYSAEKVVRLLSQTHIPDYGIWKASRDQPQRYDGMRPTQNQPLNPSKLREQEVYAGQGDWHTSDARRFADPYPGHSNIVHQRDAPRYMGVPEPSYRADSSWPGREGFDIQGTEQSFRAESSRPGHDVVQTSNAQGWQPEGPYLTPANDWYYQ